MKRVLLLLIVLLFFTGCAATRFDNLNIANRTVKFSILGIIEYEKTTEALEAGGVEITDSQ